MPHSERRRVSDSALASITTNLFLCELLEIIFQSVTATETLLKVVAMRPTWFRCTSKSFMKTVPELCTGHFIGPSVVKALGLVYMGCWGGKTLWLSQVFTAPLGSSLLCRKAVTRGVHITQPQSTSGTIPRLALWILPVLPAAHSPFMWTSPQLCAMHVVVTW